MFQNRKDIDEHPDFDMFCMEDCHIIGNDGYDDCCKSLEIPLTSPRILGCGHAAKCGLLHPEGRRGRQANIREPRANIRESLLYNAYKE
jgi:hypothetical protein